MRRWSLITLVLAAAVLGFGQTPDYPCIFKQFAGAFPLGDGGAAAQALLYNPVATQVDSSGTLYILDQSNFRIRKVASNGTITTLAETKVGGVSPAATDMKRGSDDSLYVSTPGRILKISATGTVGVLAGTATTGTSPDGTSAAQANLSVRLTGLALDSAGLVYFVEDHRVRMIKADGTLATVAGSAAAGYGGDNGPAASALLNYPVGIAFDASNNLYIADYLNYRIRKVTNGTITTVAGTGTQGVPTAGSATSSAFGTPTGITVDSAGNLLVVDSAYFVVCKISGASLSLLAGSGTFSYSDGPALGTYLYGPVGITADSAGNIFVAEKTSHRVRKISGSTTSTVAGRLHFAGDGGPAISAVLNLPVDVALDPQGLAAVIDSENFRVRRVAANGAIDTIVGNGIPALPANAAQANGSSLPKMSAATYDSLGNLYLAVTDPSLFGSRILCVDTAGAITRFAGSSLPGVQFNLTASGGSSGTCTLSTPVVTSIGSLTDFGNLKTFNSGSWLQIKGTNLATAARLWAGSDFQRSNAPTSLDGTGVTVNGKPAFVYYISGTQVNVQAPADAAIGSAGPSVSAARPRLSSMAGYHPEASGNSSSISSYRMSPTAISKSISMCAVRKSRRPRISQ